MLLLVSSLGRSRVPRRSVVEVTLISRLQDQGSSRSSGDLLLLLVPEGNREICGLWAPSEMPAARAGHRNAESRQNSQGWGMGVWWQGPPCGEMLEYCRWEAAKVQREGRVKNSWWRVACPRQGVKRDCPPGREREAMGYEILQNTPRAGAFVSADDLAENFNCQLVMPKVEGDRAKLEWRGGKLWQRWMNSNSGADLTEKLVQSKFESCSK